MVKVLTNGYNVKGIKSFEGIEGLGFNATLYKDNKKIAFVIDEGCGGEPIFHFFERNGEYRGDKDEKELRAYVATLPRVKFDDHELTMDIGWFVTELVNQYEVDKKYKVKCKNHTCFKLQGDSEEQFWSVNRPYSPKVKEYLKKKYSDKLVEIINERYT